MCEWMSHTLLPHSHCYCLPCVFVKTEGHCLHDKNNLRLSPLYIVILFVIVYIVILFVIESHFVAIVAVVFVYLLKFRGIVAMIMIILILILLYKLPYL